MLELGLTPLLVAFLAANPQQQQQNSHAPTQAQTLQPASITAMNNERLGQVIASLTAKVKNLESSLQTVSIPFSSSCLRRATLSSSLSLIDISSRMFPGCHPRRCCRASEAGDERVDTPTSKPRPGSSVAEPPLGPKRKRVGVDSFSRAVELAADLEPCLPSTRSVPRLSASISTRPRTPPSTKATLRSTSLTTMPSLPPLPTRRTSRLVRTPPRPSTRPRRLPTRLSRGRPSFRSLRRCTDSRA